MLMSFARWSSGWRGGEARPDVAEVTWTTRARADLAEVAEYHASRSPDYAEVLVRRLLSAVRRLDIFPESGRVVPEMTDDAMREVVYRDYRIFYLYDDEEDRVEVLSMFHSSRQFGTPPSS